MSIPTSPPPIPPRRPQSVGSTKQRPPIPPRPVARAPSKRKPVPAHDAKDLISASQSSLTVSRSPDTSLTKSDTGPHYSLPISPPSLFFSISIISTCPSFANVSSREGADDHYVSWRHRREGKRNARRGFISGEERRKRRWWIIGGIFLLLIVIIVAVVAAVVSKRSSNKTSSSGQSTDNGGHPLSIEDGGVDIGQPGDIARYGSGSSDHFVLQMNRSTVVSRFDPIVSPGKVSSHVHRFYGSSLVDEIRRNASEAITLGKCSTTPVQDDHSQYWVPQLYWRSPDNGSFTMVPIRYHAAYYFQKAPTGQTIHPFPDNYNVVAGNPLRREVDPNDMSQRGLWWQCFRGGGDDSTTLGFPDSACSGGLIQLIIMPSCWDGVVASDGAYGSHVSYPIDAVNGHVCPPQFPQKFMTVQFETNFAVGIFPFNGAGEVTWVLANGDATGYGIHADFVNGWKPEVQQAILDNCRYMNKTAEYPSANDLHNCPPLVPSIDYAAASQCRFQGQIIDEEVGQGGKLPLQLLPGCNALWQGTGEKPDCPAGRQEGQDLLDKVEPRIWIKDEPYVT